MTPLNIENLTLIRAELFDFADSIALASPDTAKDARLVARAADKLLACDSGSPKLPKCH
jgi:hypothetical protein